MIALVSYLSLGNCYLFPGPMHISHNIFSYVKSSSVLASEVYAAVVRPCYPLLSNNKFQPV